MISNLKYESLVKKKKKLLEKQSKLFSNVKAILI